MLELSVELQVLAEMNVLECAKKKKKKCVHWNRVTLELNYLIKTGTVS